MLLLKPALVIITALLRVFEGTVHKARVAAILRCYLL
jgi:hypothetical protein